MEEAEGPLLRQRGGGPGRRAESGRGSGTEEGVLKAQETRGQGEGPGTDRDGAVRGDGGV